MSFSDPLTVAGACLMALLVITALAFVTGVVIDANTEREIRKLLGEDEDDG